MSIQQCVDWWLGFATTPGHFYCNELNLRCSDPQCRDCSTFAASGLNAGFPGCTDPCGNSFSQAAWCYNAPRPAFFSQRFGPGQGTFITKDQAQHVVCLGFHGTDFGMRPDWSGDGHVEVVLGQGTRTVGAHSHRDGVGIDNTGFTFNFVEFYAVPPCFLPEMAGPPVDIATLAAIKRLVEWEERCTARPLHQRQTNGDVTILNSLLIAKNLLDPRRQSNTYTRWTAGAAAHFKRARQLPNLDGSVWGADAAHAILHPVG